MSGNYTDNLKQMSRLTIEDLGGRRAQVRILRVLG